MHKDPRIQVFTRLGERLKTIRPDIRDTLFQRAANENSWFTARAFEMAIEGIIRMLNEEKLISFLSRYDFKCTTSPRKIGLVLAGNIPAVGFHDILITLLSGNTAVVKLSSKDKVLLRYIFEEINLIDPDTAQRIQETEKLDLRNIDGVIATGSDNTTRYFSYYFKNVPHVIRGNRTSVAIIDGFESQQTIASLGEDIFTYFGLGCRNVSKIYVPEGYDLTKFLDAMEAYNYVSNHHKYVNNYDYNKSIFLINGVKHLDNGFLLLKEDEGLVSPLSVIFYEYYKDQEELNHKIHHIEDKLQCIVGTKHQPLANVKIGYSQFPEIHNFADGVDTMSFLLKL